MYRHAPCLHHAQFLFNVYYKRPQSIVKSRRKGTCARSKGRQLAGKLPMIGHCALQYEYIVCILNGVTLVTLVHLLKASTKPCCDGRKYTFHQSIVEQVIHSWCFLLCRELCQFALEAVLRFSKTWSSNFPFLYGLHFWKVNNYIEHE